MMPPPITSSRSGTSSSSSAPVESTMRGSSGKPGSITDCEPAAMTACSKAISSPSTSSECGPVKRPVPCTTRTLRPLAICASPPVSRSTVRCLKARTPSRSISGSPNFTPCSAASSPSAMTRATWSSALEGMQPTLRQTPPREA
jgi:hypothetical protein